MPGYLGFHVKQDNIDILIDHQFWLPFPPPPLVLEMTLVHEVAHHLGYNEDHAQAIEFECVGRISPRMAQ